MDHQSLTVTICAALLALTGAAVWFGYKKHHYLLWLCAALVLAAGAQVLRDTVSFWTGWHVSAMFVLLLMAAVALVQAMVQRFGRSQSPWMTLAGGALMAAAVAWAYHFPPAQWWHRLVMSAGLVLLLGQVLPVTWYCVSRHRVERLLMLLYLLLMACAVLSPWVWPGARWGAQILGGALVVLAGALLPGAMIMCALEDRKKSAYFSDCDDLTGLLTAKSFAAACGERPSDQQVSVLVLCSLDQLQQLREQYGPELADRVLAQFAALLRGKLRDGDLLARVSSDEIGVALSRIRPEAAQQLLQRVREDLREQRWLPQPAQGPLSACFGLVIVQDGEPYDHMLHRAYVLLCQAKEAGNDCLGFEEQSQERVVPLSQYIPAM